MLDTIMSVLSGAAGGGIIGLGGTFLSLAFKAFTTYQERKAKQEEWAHELDVMRVEGELAMKQAEANLKAIDAEAAGKLAVTQEEQAGAALQASYRNDKATYSNGFVAKMLAGGVVARFFGSIGAFFLIFLDFVRGAMRPAITGASLYMLWYIADQIKALDVNNMSLELQQSLSLKIVEAVVMLATSSALWWFGTRPTRTDKK